MSSVRTGMSIGILLMLILSSLLMVLSSSKADAQTACNTELEALESAIRSATFTNPQDQQNLLIKLQKAEAKLAEGKTQDAVAKITDIRSAVAKLAAGGKLDPEDATDIDAAAASAITCLEGTSST
jgi:hypothetical protein